MGTSTGVTTHMAYYIYHKETTIIYRKHWYSKPYETEAAAKAGMTRAEKKDPNFKREDYAIADVETFHNNIEKQEIKQSIMGGAHYRQGVNEPACTDPSTETYWSM